MSNEFQASKDLTVGVYRYKVTHAPVEKAWEVGIELTKLIAEPAALMSDATGGKVSEALGNAVRALLSKIDPKQSLALVKKILSTVEVQGLEGEIENKKFMLDDAGIKTHFHGRSGAMLLLAGEVVAFTHEDFFKAMMDGIAQMMDKSSK